MKYGKFEPGYIDSLKKKVENSAFMGFLVYKVAQTGSQYIIILKLNGDRKTIRISNHPPPIASADVYLTPDMTECDLKSAIETEIETFIN